MIILPMGEGSAFAQMSPPPAAPQSEPQPETLTSEELDQLVAPVALYPDALLAQVLAAATYPTQVVEAHRWLQERGNLPPGQIADLANRMSWDPSVKALTAFPSVLERMDRNIGWTTDLGNAYYNQPEAVMDSVQAMRAHAREAGNLRSTPQQRVTEEDGTIVIAPAEPNVVYVPVYDPWAVWGYPVAMYPGFYYYAPPGIFVGGLLIGFGVGIGIGAWGHWGWGWHHWRVRWRDRAVFYNQRRYHTRSRTVIDRGRRRRGGPPRHIERRPSRPAPSMRRPGQRIERGTPQRRQVAPSRPGAVPTRPRTAPRRPGASRARPGGTSGTPSAGSRSGGRAPRSAGTRGSSGRAGGAGSGGRSGGGGGRSGGGGGKR